MGAPDNERERTVRRSRTARAGGERREDAVVSKPDWLYRELERALERERQRCGVLEARLASSVQGAAALQEEERRQIARDVHDHLGQQMTALRIELQLLYPLCTLPSQ